VPNPLSKVTPHPVDIQLGPEALQRRPELAVRLAAVVSSWAYVEETNGEILATLMGTQSAIGVAIYSKIYGTRVRRDVLGSAALTVLSGADLRLFDALMDETRSIQGARNDLVHELWGYADQLPDKLLLVRVSEHLPVMARKHWLVPREFLDTVQVYTAADFDSLFARCQALYKHLTMFNATLALPPEQRDAGRQQLASVPEIRERVNRKTGSQSS